MKELSLEIVKWSFSAITVCVALLFVYCTGFLVVKMTSDIIKNRKEKDGKK